MIGTLRGTLSVKSTERLVIEVGGVGYEVSVPVSLLSDLPEAGSDVFLHIYTHVKDDALELFGFPDKKAKTVFRTLLKITGVGPRLALNILSGTTVDDFLHAVESEDVGLLMRLPGIGKKTAQRILFELKEKLPVAGEMRDRAYEDTLSALMNLGYKKSHSQEALDAGYQKGIRDVETLLKEALQYLNQ